MDNTSLYLEVLIQRHISGTKEEQLTTAVKVS